jgi:hypothetical protein
MENNIKKDVIKKGCEDVDWIQLALDKEGSMTTSYEHGNKPANPINVGEVIDQIIDCYLLKMQAQSTP